MEILRDRLPVNYPDSRAQIVSYWPPVISAVSSWLSSARSSLRAASADATASWEPVYSMRFITRAHTPDRTRFST